MKHKAQESLNHMIDHIGALHWLYNHEIDKEQYFADKKRMQDLINCQLTVEEMNYIRNLLYIVPDKDRTIIISILAKLSKQKEMWVSEDVD